MATSGVISTVITAREVMINAAQDLGVLGSGETLTGEEYQSMMSRLNYMLKSWQALGCNLWRKTTGEITIPADTASGALDPNVIDVYAARVVVGTIELPIMRWEDGQYRQVPNKASPGRPTAFYIDKQRDRVDLFVWPVPKVETVIKIDYARVIEDVTDPNETLDVPQQWAETVWKCLGSKCANLFGATRLDPNAVALLKQEASVLEDQLLNQDRPSSIFMGSYNQRMF